VTRLGDFAGLHAVGINEVSLIRRRVHLNEIICEAFRDLYKVLAEIALILHF